MLGTLSAAGIERLLHIYGGRAAAIADLASTDPGLSGTLGHEERVLSAEGIFALREEFALTLTDVVFRRMMIGFDADQGSKMYSEVAAIAAQEAGWSPEQQAQQLDGLTKYAKSLRVG